MRVFFAALATELRVLIIVIGKPGRIRTCDRHVWNEVSLIYGTCEKLIFYK